MPVEIPVARPCGLSPHPGRSAGPGLHGASVAGGQTGVCRSGFRLRGPAGCPRLRAVLTGRPHGASCPGRPEICVLQISPLNGPAARRSTVTPTGIPPPALQRPGSVDSDGTHGTGDVQKLPVERLLQPALITPFPAEFDGFNQDRWPQAGLQVLLTGTVKKQGCFLPSDTRTCSKRVPGSSTCSAADARTALSKPTGSALR